MRLGRCDDCGHPYTTYHWHGSLRLSQAVCPVHGTPLARTTMPQDRRGRLIYLYNEPTRHMHERYGDIVTARRHGSAQMQPLRGLLAPVEAA